LGKFKDKYYPNFSIAQVDLALMVDFEVNLRKYF